MISIAEQSLVTVYSDALAFLLVLGLFYMFHQYKVGRGRYSDKLFNLLCITTMVNALTNGFSYAMHGQKIGWAMPLKLIAPSIAELSTAVIMFLWMLYVDYKLYGSHERIAKIQRYFSIPIMILAFLTVINLFTGIMFYMDENTMFVGRPLYYIMEFIQYLYGLMPIVVVIYYTRHHGRPHFFHISPLVIPALVAALFTLITDYSARALGFAVGLLFIHFSSIIRWRYDDEESGFYNRQYVDHICDLIRDGKRDYNGAVIIEAKNIDTPLFEVLKEEIPKDSEMIRADRNKFVLLSEVASDSMFDLMIDMFKESADSYDKDHPSELPISLTGSSVIRMSGESATDFVRRATS